MGERQQQLTRPKQRGMGVARQPMKISGRIFEQRGPINHVE
jgi:hypothetical protein